jgi:hypothetical protein
VTEDRLLEKLKKDLAGDFAPVKPLKESWKRALWILPITMLFMEFTLAVFHLRTDYAAIGLPVLWIFCSIQVIVCFLIFKTSLKSCVPGSYQSPLSLACIGLTGLAIYLFISWRTFQISPFWPPAGRGLSLGIACMTTIGVMGILALLFGLFLTRRGLPLRARATGLLLGLGSGLAAEAAWRLHCPITSWRHILLFHTGAVFIVVVLGMVLGYFWRRR